MDLTSLVDRIGDDSALALGGFVIGAAFGAAAQQSRFCLRSAVIEFSTRTLGGKVAIWAVAFSTAVATTQVLIATGVLDVSQARQLASRGSISGATIGGLMFGSGMIFARGCASRLLVLSATGNLRALISGLIVTLIAQASLRGVLSPMREAIANLWIVEGGQSRNILSVLHLGSKVGVILGMTWLAIGVWLAIRSKLTTIQVVSAACVGAMIAAGWAFTYWISTISFIPVQIKSISFTGPSADTLMALINAPTVQLGFDIGLVPGVFVGSFLAAAATRELKLEGYSGGASMTRYILGACLMGFGGMLAGGCAVGAGVTGGAIFAVTAWIALMTMWLAATVTTIWLGEQ